MTELDFLQGIRQLYATFGKKLPEKDILDEIFRRVQDMPAEFMAFALTRLQDEEKLPANLGRYLAHEIWADWQIQNGLKTLAVQSVACKECDPRTPGWIPVIRGMYDYLAKCVCNSDTRYPEPGRTRQQLVDAGFILRPMGARQ